MVSGSLQKDNHLDKIIESKRLQKLESVHKCFGEVSDAFFLVRGGCFEEAGFSEKWVLWRVAYFGVVDVLERFVFWIVWFFGDVCFLDWWLLIVVTVDRNHACRFSSPRTDIVFSKTQTMKHNNLYVSHERRTFIFVDSSVTGVDHFSMTVVMLVVTLE